MNRKSKKENDASVLGSQSHGVGGHGVAEQKGSDDDVFTDEQPSRKRILEGKGESIPLLGNGWGSYGEYRLVGNGKVTNENCGNFRGFKGCLRVDLHDKITLDGRNFKGKIFARRVYFSCDKPSCPKCYKYGWAVREAGNIERRLKEASKRFGLVEHIICSVPSKDYGLSDKTLRRKVIKMLKELGVVGGCIIVHHFRYSPYKGWYFSPHFHVLGFILGGYAECRHCKGGDCYACNGFEGKLYKLYHKNGYIVKVMGKRITVGGTAWYQLNHASYKVGGKRHTVATWFGNCSYRKLKVTVEMRKAVCPICQYELVYLRYVGGACVVKSKDDPDYCRDSFEDYYDSSGRVAWIEAPRKRYRRIAVARNLLTPEDFASPVTQDWIDKMFPKRVNY